MKLLVTLILAITLGVNSLDNGLSRTPPMGWMAWQRFRCVTDCKNYPDECIRYLQNYFDIFMFLLKKLNSMDVVRSCLKIMLMLWLLKDI